MYDLAVGGAKVGTGSMTIVDSESINGHDTYHSVFEIKGGFLFFKVNDRLESWFEPGSATSHRFYQLLNEGSYHKEPLLRDLSRPRDASPARLRGEAQRSRAAR